jgi:hypothetical protein
MAISPINQMSKVERDTIETDPTETAKKDWRRDKLATRIDLRMPNEIYDRVLEIAISSGEKINPKTNQVRVTATLNKLIELGIQHYPDRNPSQIDPIAQLPETIELARCYRELSDKYQELEQKLSDISARSISEREGFVNRTPELMRGEVETIVANYVDAALAPLVIERQAMRDRLAAIESELTKLTKPA